MNDPRVITVKKDILAKNDALAANNQLIFKESGVIVVNLLSSPGAGKTTLLVKTLTDLKSEIKFAVIEGDQRTDNDARRIMETGVPVTQINTQSACHLDAGMTFQALDTLDLGSVDMLFIENVGNLVCPASYDLGEQMKITLLSVTEGEDKPVKYPKAFRVADAMVLTKTDLLPYLDFDPDQAMEYARKVNPAQKRFRLSAKSGAGLEEWYQFLRDLTNGS